MALKDNSSQKEKKIRKDKHDEKTSKSKCEFHGEELLGPQASLRVARYGEFSNTGLGGRVRKFVQMRLQSSVSGQQ